MLQLSGMGKNIHVHFLGIGGSGASAIAAIAQTQGFKISGCDKYPINEFTGIFDRNILKEGHSVKHLEGVDILAVTPAIFSADPNNEELKSARDRGIKTMTWQEFMGEFLEKDKFVIGVCGTHGKSTITAMIGLILEDAGLDPTVELGAIVPRWNTNFRTGKSKYFITEADEFNDNFLPSKPDIAVVTTIEMDHPEYFKDYEDIKSSFREFLTPTREKIIANLLDNGVRDVLNNISSENTEIVNYSKNLINFPLLIPGRFNLLNASAAFQVGLALNIDPVKIQKSLETFTGVGRRFEFLGDINGGQIYTDFAHHPTELKVTVQAARDKYPESNLIVFFQPHMYSRTLALFNEFVEVLKNLPVSHVYLLDIYKAREPENPNVSSQKLAETINDPKITYIKDEDIDRIIHNTNENDVVIFMGAGPIDGIARRLVLSYRKSY